MMAYPMNTYGGRRTPIVGPPGAIDNPRSLGAQRDNPLGGLHGSATRPVLNQYGGVPPGGYVSPEVEAANAAYMAQREAQRPADEAAFAARGQRELAHMAAGGSRFGIMQGVPDRFRGPQTAYGGSAGLPGNTRFAAAGEPVGIPPLENLPPGQGGHVGPGQAGPLAGGPPQGMNPLEWVNEPGIDEAERQRRDEWHRQHPFAGQPGVDPVTGQPLGGGPGGQPGGDAGPGLPGQPGGPGGVSPNDLPPELRDPNNPVHDDPALPGNDDDWVDPGPGGPFGEPIPQPPDGAGGFPDGGNSTTRPPQTPGGGPGNGGNSDNGGNNGGGGGFPPIIPPGPQTGVGPTIPGGGYTGGGGNNELIAALLADYQRANQEGRQANETRYNDLINYLNMRLDRGLANLQGSGDQALADVDRDYARMSADIDQDMISRGLRNSTVRQNVQRGAQDDRQANRRRIQEDVRKERLQTDAVLSGDVLSAMERRTDDYPSSSELIALALQLGQGGYYPMYGGGGGGGGGGGRFITLPGGGLVNNPGYTQQNSNPFGLNRHSPTGTRWG
jgi:hypothetical protein